eukprot:TRINITY_DN20915_c0_g1_i1.p3 TRINITY_DN20915_c0_g1~~TRINITY_DN20915_c0_g1_i1.p3  ORF type:complete len:137 (-),score=41.04 TRINITY_DN20915_c0_g1_i1:224-634(-)
MNWNTTWYPESHTANPPTVVRRRRWVRTLGIAVDEARRHEGVEEARCKQEGEHLTDRAVAALDAETAMRNSSNRSIAGAAGESAAAALDLMDQRSRVVTMNADAAIEMESKMEATRASSAALAAQMEKQNKDCTLM